MFYSSFSLKECQSQDVLKPHDARAAKKLLSQPYKQETKRKKEDKPRKKRQSGPSMAGSDSVMTMEEKDEPPSKKNKKGPSSTTGSDSGLSTSQNEVIQLHIIITGIDVKFNLTALYRY